MSSPPGGPTPPAQIDPVFLLDLCILAYQLHSQSLVLAPDPYGEQMRNPSRAGEDERRDRYLSALDDVLSTRGTTYHGSVYSTSNGWTRTRPGITPIPSNYDRISPLMPGVVQQNRTNSDEGWIVYDAPKAITDPIGDVKVASYDPAVGPDATPPGVRFAPSSTDQALRATLVTRPPAPDLLYAFEGGTGKRSTGEGPSWSLMGYVLAREDVSASRTAPPYDVFVVFRGSRSGEVRPGESVFSKVGNPDWLTNTKDLRTQVPSVASREMHKGFALALESMLPTIQRCLAEVQTAKKAAPRDIYVTGHSLGGALALCFASAVALGNRLGPQGAKVLALGSPPWRWQRMSVVTFAAPGIGDQSFVDALDTAVEVRGFRLRGDLVPGAFMRKDIRQPDRPRVLSGRVVTLPSSADKDAKMPYAHSPKYIRAALQAHLTAVLKRPGDSLSPWQEALDVGDVLTKLSESRLPGRPYQFREGLDLYLETFSKMGAFNNQGSRLSSADVTTLDTFRKNLTTTSKAMSISFLTEAGKALGTLRGVTKIKDDSGLTFLLKMWLALCAVEEGLDWRQAQKSSGVLDFLKDEGA